MLGTANDYAARKQAEAQARGQWIEQQEAADAAAVSEMQAAQQAAAVTPPAQTTANLQAGLQALYEGRKAGEVQLSNIACTPENTQKPKNLLQRAWDWTTDHAGKIAKSVKSAAKALSVRNLKFNRLEDGHISVRAETPPGTRLDYKNLAANEGFDFAGTRYNPETVAGITSKGIWEKMGKGALSKGSLAFAGVVSLGQNLLTFGEGKKFGSPEYWDATVKNRAFWVSTAVDFAVSVAVGVAAAAVMAGGIALLAGTAIGAVLALPAVAIVATVGVGIVIGMGVDATGFPSMAKTWLNGLFSGQ